MKPVKLSDPTTPDIELFNFDGPVNASNYKEFLVWAAKNAVSDIHVQGGNPIVIERYGRMVPVTTFSLPDNILSDIIDGLFDPELRAKVGEEPPRTGPYSSMAIRINAMASIAVNDCAFAAMLCRRPLPTC